MIDCAPVALPSLDILPVIENSYSVGPVVTVLRGLDREALVHHYRAKALTLRIARSPSNMILPNGAATSKRLLLLELLI